MSEKRNLSQMLHSDLVVKSASTRSAAIALATLFFLGNIGVAVSAAQAHAVPPGFSFLYLIGVAWAIAWWVLADCRERNIPSSIDHGWLVFFAWPLVLPYHLIKTRGLKGCGVLATLVGLFVVAYLTALATFFLLTR